MDDNEEERAFNNDTSARPSTENKIWRPLKELLTLEKGLLLATLFNSLMTLIITIARMASVSSDSPDCVVGGAILIGTVFCMFYVVEGILTTRPTVLIILTIAFGAMAIFLIGDYAIGKKNSAEFVRLVANCLMGAVIVGMALLAARMYNRENRLPRLVIGDSEIWQIIYTKLLFFQDILKIDLQFGVLSLFLAFTLHSSTGTIVAAIIGGVYLLSWFILGYRGMMKESRLLAVIFFVLSVVGFGYLVYYFYVVGKRLDEEPGLSWTILLCSLTYLIVHTCAVFAGVLSFRNFGSGMATRLRQESASTL